MKKIKIAIVDDHKIVCESLEMVLNQFENFKVILIAHDGKDFLHQIKLFKLVPDVVLMDIEMPIMNGYSAALNLRILHPQSKVIFVTSYTKNLFVQKGIVSNCNGFISKSCDVDILKEAIEQVNTNGHYFNELLSVQNMYLAETETKDFKDLLELHTLKQELETQIQSFDCSEKIKKLYKNETKVRKL